VLRQPSQQGVSLREAADAGFDVLNACAFNYDADASEFTQLGRIPVLKVHMNADLHMADDLKNTGKNQVCVNGVDVFHPDTGDRE
jgi:adenine-specific DNA-methyltransferase